MDRLPIPSQAGSSREEARWVPAGERRLRVTCNRYDRTTATGAGTGTVEHEITIPVEAGRSYHTGGRTYEILPFII